MLGLKIHTVVYYTSAYSPEVVEGRVVDINLLYVHIAWASRNNDSVSWYRHDDDIFWSRITFCCQQDIR